jgi:hypothetical protein
MKPRKPFWGLLYRRQCLAPTWRGWLLLVIMIVAMGNFAVRMAQPFLAVTAPLPGGPLVIEGWAPDYVMQEVIAEFKRRAPPKLYVTGGPLELGAPLSEYKTFAELGTAVLIRLGMNRDTVQPVPSSWVRQDRTYTAAIALRSWWRQHGGIPATFTIITSGTHARRTRLLYEKAFGNEARVGVISIPNRDYDTAHWWRSSQGVRVVTDELIAYTYTRFFFFPSGKP